MGEHERQVFIELNGYDPTTREGLIKHIRELLSRRDEGARQMLLTTAGPEQYALNAAALDRIDKIIHNAYAMLGRIVYDDANGDD